MKKRNLFLVPAIFAMFLSACGGNTSSDSNVSTSGDTLTTDITTDITTSTQDDVLVSSIQISATKTTLNLGETVSFTVNVLPENATLKTFDLILEKDGVLTLEGQSVTAVGVGQCKVYAMAKDGSGVQGELNFVVEDANPQFQSSNVIVIGDVHINDKDLSTQDHLRKTLQYVKDNKIDTVIFNGDSTDYSSDDLLGILNSILLEKFPESDKANRPTFIFNMGNHDFYADDSSRHEETVYAREHSRFRTFANKWMTYQIKENENVYSIVVDGINYICAFPGIDAYYEEEGKTIYEAALGHFSDNDLQKLEDKIAEAAERDAEKPIVVLTHWPLGETYGGDKYGVNNTGDQVEKFKTIYSKYPQVVNLTSHTHFSNLHDKDIAQSTFTSINVGTHCYAKYVSDIEKDENGDVISYANIDSPKNRIKNDAVASAQHGKTNFGLQLSFGATKLSVNRVNFAKQALYSHGTFDVPYGITKDNMNEKFAYASGKRTGPELTWSGDDNLVVTANEKANKVEFNITLKDVDQYYAAEGYKIDFEDTNGTLLDSMKWASVYWADLGQKSTYTFSASLAQKEDNYVVKAYPIDFYGHYGDPISYNVTTTPNQYAEQEGKEIESGDLLFSSTIDFNSFSESSYTFDNYCTNTCDSSSGLSYHVVGDNTAVGWPSIKLRLPHAYDLSNSGIGMSINFNNIHPWISYKLYNSNNVKVNKESGFDYNKNLANTWQNGIVGNAILRNDLADGFTIDDLKDILYIEITFNFDEYSGSTQEIYFDELHVVESATKTENWEMMALDDGWCNGTEAAVSYSDTKGSASARKFTFKNSLNNGSQTLAADGSDQVYFAFAPEFEWNVGPTNISVTNVTMTFDVKLSQEFFDNDNPYKHMFTLQFVDSGWAHMPDVWLDWVPAGASGYSMEMSDNGWLHFERDLSTIEDPAEFAQLDNNLIRLRFGVWGLTPTTQQTASLIIDNLKITPNAN